MNVIRNKSPGDREIVDVLLAISHVFARLAMQVLSLASLPMIKVFSTKERNDKHGKLCNNLISPL